MKQPKNKKKRASKYEKPLKINGSFEDAIKELVSNPETDYKKPE